MMDILITNDPATLEQLAQLVGALDDTQAALGNARDRLKKLEALADQKEAEITRLQASKIGLAAPQGRIDALLSGKTQSSIEQIDAAKQSRLVNAEIDDRIAVETADLNAIHHTFPSAKNDLKSAEARVVAARDELADTIGKIMVAETLDELAELAVKRLEPLNCIGKFCGDKDAVGSVTRLIGRDPLFFVDHYVSRSDQRDWEKNSLSKADGAGRPVMSPLAQPRSRSTLRDIAGLASPAPAPEDVLELMIEFIRINRRSPAPARKSDF